MNIKINDEYIIKDVSLIKEFVSNESNGTNKKICVINTYKVMSSLVIDAITKLDKIKIVAENTEEGTEDVIYELLPYTKCTTVNITYADGIHPTYQFQFE